MLINNALVVPMGMSVPSYLATRPQLLGGPVRLHRFLQQAAEGHPRAGPLRLDERVRGQPRRPLTLCLIHNPQFTGIVQGPLPYKPGSGPLFCPAGNPAEKEVRIPMASYLARRIGHSILTLFIIVTPGVLPAPADAGGRLLCQLRKNDRDPDPGPASSPWAFWTRCRSRSSASGGDAFHGDLGVSHIYRVNVPVVDILKDKLPISIQMGVLAMIVSLVVGIPLGSVMGRFKHRLPDQIGTAIVILIRPCPPPSIISTSRCTAPLPSTSGLLFNADRWQYWVLPVFFDESGQHRLLCHVAAAVHGGRE